MKLAYIFYTAPMIVWLVSMTRVDSRHDLWWLALESSDGEKNGDLNQLESRFFTEWLESSHSQWLETRVRVISHSQWLNTGVKVKISEFLMDKPSLFAHKEISIFLLKWWSRLAQVFCFACLVVLCCILGIKFPQIALWKTWGFFFYWRVCRAQYIDTLL